jgi:hypothetical protein
MGVLAGERVGPLAGERQVARVVALQCDTPRRENPVYAGTKDIGEAALADEEDVFVDSNGVTEHERAPQFLEMMYL